MRTFARISVALLSLNALAAALAADNPFIGDWALTIPGGAAGWLGVEESNGKLQANLLWGGGSVLPMASAKIEDGKLVVTRTHTAQRKAGEGKSRATIVETMTGTVEGDVINFTSTRPRDNGQGEETAYFSGHRQPPPPPAPDLSKVKFGEAIQLFDGKDLNGWRLTAPGAVNGWSVKDGILMNEPVQEEGKPHKNYGNLRTDREFEDFNLKVETRVGKGQNSGVYVRGRYEVQIETESEAEPPSHHTGGVYGFLAPSPELPRKPDTWQSFDITLIGRKVTVVQNGQTVINNQEIPGITGGAVNSHEAEPGPIYLQGDHTGIEYRSLVLRPVLKGL